jgi:altronate dehydratase
VNFSAVGARSSAFSNNGSTFVVGRVLLLSAAATAPAKVTNISMTKNPNVGITVIMVGVGCFQLLNDIIFYDLLKKDNGRYKIMLTESFP